MGETAVSSDIRQEANSALMEIDKGYNSHTSQDIQYDIHSFIVQVYVVVQLVINVRQ